MSVSVIIVNWNGLGWLDGCLDALRHQHVPACELIVVDNASSDGSADHVRSSHPDVRLIALDDNRGFAGGNNAGAASARSDYLVFLNNDTRVRRGWLQALIDVADRDPSVGLVTSQIVYMDEPDVVDSAGDGYLRAGGGFKHFHGLPAASASSSREVFGACGGAFLIRRALFEALERVRRGLLHGLRGRRSLVPGASAWRARHLRARRRGRTRRQRFAGTGERSCRVLRSAQPRVDLAEEFPPAAALAIRALSPPLRHRRRRGVRAARTAASVDEGQVGGADERAVGDDEACEDCNGSPSPIASRSGR